MRHDSTDREPASASPISRRRVLSSGAVLGVGAAGLAASSSSVSAGEVLDCLDWIEAPEPYPTVDLAADDVPTRDVPTGVEEICCYAHGWMGRKSSDDQAHTLSLALAENGYEEPVVALTWESDTLDFWGAERNAETAGNRLAEWFESYREANPETRIRLVGHSLGARVSLSALSSLDGAERVTSAALLGAAVDDDTVCADGRYAAGIEESAEQVVSYHSRNDRIVCGLYELSGFGSGLGCAGSDCGGWFRDGETPANFTEVDVTEQVEDHCDFKRPEEGCIDQVVADF